MSWLGLHSSVQKAANRLLEMVLPEDSIFQSKTKTEAIREAKRNIEGLVAVGIPFHDAAQPFVKTLSMQTIVDMSVALEPSGIAMMRSLYILQKGFEDKKAFGKACMKAGFSPVGVAMAAIEERSEADSKAVAAAKGDFQLEEGRNLIRLFGVDTWMTACLQVDRFGGKGSSMLLLNREYEFKMQAPKLFVVGGIRLSKDRFESPHAIYHESDFDIPWLAEVGGVLRIRGQRGMRFSSLTFAGSIEAGQSSDIAFPVLERIEGELGLGEAKNIQALSLVYANSMRLYRAENIDLPSLAIVGDGVSTLMDASHVLLPNLTCIKGKVGDFEAVCVYAPKLKSVNGEPFVCDAEEL